MRRFKQLKRECETGPVQSVMSVETIERLKDAASRRKMSVSAFVENAVEKLLDEVKAKESGKC
jgi:hypothetical protein